jgi:hypothetical protein
MNARPALQFAMRLAGHLKMTLGELFVRMDSKEFTRWLAYHFYYEPIGGHWEQTGTIAAAMLAPYTPRGKKISPDDFIPRHKNAPQHKTQIDDVLMQIARDLGQQ